MNRNELWRRGRVIAEALVARLREDKTCQGISCPIFLSEADYLRAHAMIDVPAESYHPWEEYCEKVRGTLSFLTDTDGVVFVDMIKCLDAVGREGLEEIKKEIYIIGPQRLNFSMLAPYFALKLPQHVLKPSQVGYVLKPSEVKV